MYPSVHIFLLTVYMGLSIFYFVWSWQETREVQNYEQRQRHGKFFLIYYLFLGLWPFLGLFLFAIFNSMLSQLIISSFLFLTGLLYYCSGSADLRYQLMKRASSQIPLSRIAIIKVMLGLSGLGIIFGGLVTLYTLGPPFDYFTADQGRFILFILFFVLFFRFVTLLIIANTKRQVAQMDYQRNRMH